MGKVKWDTRPRRIACRAAAPREEARHGEWIFRLLLTAVTAVLAAGCDGRGSRNAEKGGANATNPPAAPLRSATAPPPAAEVAQALMVTVELDFAGTPPSIREALSGIERRY